MSESRWTTVVTVGLGQGRKVDCVSTARGQQMTHIRDDPRPSPRPIPRRGARPMHQSTLTLGCPSAHPCYATTHARSYSRRGEDGRPLCFYYRDAPFPSQHLSSLKLSHMVPVDAESHTRDIHGPKDIVPHHVLHELGLRNRKRNQLGQVMREVANPSEPTLYQTTYRSNHSHLSHTATRDHSTGLPTRWHCHDILTGEERRPAGPGEPRRRSRDHMLWAARRWETDCCALRLY
ncbi:uncharacterized protein LOC108937309 [Scleropages formosus]|uniref:uncharacterized protein LOC108937309 n=1 Tax=Scleropages formosus TaxID=113540 RepID=UPI000878F2D5|nr:uncharacterized protein LOC108937309 [Scleropages formosus]XP_018612654.1 uncharacterized protein LOC108937309 [Scleropages formosus]